MKLAPRFLLIVDVTSWCLRDALPRDLRRKISHLVACNLFAWESDRLRDERIMQHWDFVAFCHYMSDVVKQFKTHMVVETWDPAFLVFGEMKLCSIFIARRHRGIYHDQKYNWVWIEDRLPRVVARRNQL